MIAGFLLPFASGSAPAAKGVMTELCPPQQRQDAISAITSKHYLDANSDLSAAIDVSITCETGFAELKVKSPLTKENDDSRKLSTLALAITVLLK